MYPTMNNLQERYDLFKIYVDRENLSEDEFSKLKVMYVEAIEKHNKEFQNNPFCNSGFDLFTPHKYNITSNTTKINLHVKVAAFKVFSDTRFRVDEKFPIAYYLYPRSSISKTPLRLANSVGIIDSGYRGNIMAMVDLVHKDNYEVKQYTRLFQLTSPNLHPFKVEFVHTLDELGSTSRGEGGFGSTGR